MMDALRTELVEQIQRLRDALDGADRLLMGAEQIYGRDIIALENYKLKVEQQIIKNYERLHSLKEGDKPRVKQLTIEDIINAVSV